MLGWKQFIVTLFIMGTAGLLGSGAPSLGAQDSEVRAPLVPPKVERGEVDLLTVTNTDSAHLTNAFRLSVDDSHPNFLLPTGAHFYDENTKTRRMERTRLTPAELERGFVLSRRETAGIGRDIIKLTAFPPSNGNLKERKILLTILVHYLLNRGDFLGSWSNKKDESIYFDLYLRLFWDENEKKWSLSYQDPGSKQVFEVDHIHMIVHQVGKTNRGINRYQLFSKGRMVHEIDASCSVKECAKSGD